MKISQSNVAMAATREASQTQVTKRGVSAAVWTADNAVKAEATAVNASGWAEQSASLELSANNVDVEARQKQNKTNQASADIGHMIREMERLREKPAEAAPGETEEDFQIKMLRRLLESLRAMQEGRTPDYEKLEKMESKSVSLSASQSQGFSFSMAAAGVQIGSTAIVGGSGHWEEKVSVSTIFTDREVTGFSTTGQVQTADGRCIDFNLNLEMSREFTREFGMEYTRKTFCVDPLVINLEGSPASFSDQTFFFDLDANGTEEEIATLSAGSGFLALDKNDDGKINNGKELFGPQSGDGFADLSAYDEDGNGWIDENDSVFKDLKIWTKDSDGKDRLVAIGRAGVGAIYLGKAATEFSLNKAENNETQGIIRSTGIFLKESGEAGTIQHVDLIV